MMRKLAPAGTEIGLAELLGWMAAVASGRDGTKAFAEQVCSWLGVSHCFFVSSGRTALVVTMRALRDLVPSGRDEVVLPAYTCYSVPAALARAGWKIRLCDTDPLTLDYDAEALAETDFRKVACLVATNLYGIPNDLARLSHFAREHGVLLVDDAAQSLGASLGGRMVGTFGESGILSFDKGKNITSIEGGAVVCNPGPFAEALAREIKRLGTPSRASRLRSAAKVLGYAAFLRPSLYGVPSRLPSLNLGATIYSTDFPLETYKSELGAMASILFRRLEALGAGRVATAGRIQEGLQGIDGLEMISPPADAHPVFLRYPLLLRDHTRRPELVRLLEQAGLGVSTSYPTALDAIPDLQPMLVNAGQGFDGAARVARSIITLPTHGYVTDGDVSRMTGIVRGYPLTPRRIAGSALS